MDRVKIFASQIEDATTQQIEEISNCTAYKDSTIRIMPDCHKGKGSCIGFVSTFTDKIIPATIGVDQGCGMSVVELGKITIDLPKFDNQIKRSIPHGFSNRRNEVCEFPDVETMYCFEKLHKKTRKEHNLYLGTLGGGNHFIEIDKDDEDNLYLVVHSGSRQLGQRVCDYYQSFGITSEGEPSYLGYIDGELAEQYLHDLRIAQRFASANRIQIIKQILINYFYGDDVSVTDCGKVKIKNKYSKIKTQVWESIHNYIGDDNIIRKGAIQAHKGQQVIIPINMRDGAIIGKGKGNPDYLYSAPHGAGRLLSRTQAEAQVSLEDFKKSMEGIYTTTANENTIDESPFVYKSIDDILPNIEDSVEVVKIIKPIYNFKDASPKKWKRK
jgi:RNA-splicing ligase RtcB